MLEKLPLKSTKFNLDVQIFESLRVRVENESSHNKIESRERVFLENLDDGKTRK